MRKYNQEYYIYILGNKTRKVIYIGVTNNLLKRVNEHKQSTVRGFTRKYKIHDLLYYEIFNDAITAIEREKQLKKWSRIKKNSLISTLNPTLKDLANDIV